MISKKINLKVDEVNDSPAPLNYPSLCIENHLIKPEYMIINNGTVKISVKITDLENAISLIEGY